MNLRTNKNSKSDITIDLTPMVDVVFLLIIFFLITTTFQKDKTINLNLAKSKTSKVLKKNDGIVLAIDKDGNYYYGQKKVSYDKLKEILQNENKKEMILIKSDKETPYKFVVKLMGLLQDLDLNSLDFITE